MLNFHILHKVYADDTYRQVKNSKFFQQGSGTTPVAKFKVTYWGIKSTMGRHMWFVDFIPQSETMNLATEHHLNLYITL
jgi:hypothetical protein